MIFVHMVVKVHNVDHIVIGGGIIADLGYYFVPMTIACHNFIVEGLMAEFKRDIQGLKHSRKRFMKN